MWTTRGTIVIGMVLIVGVGAIPKTPEAPADEVAKLIQQLGDNDYNRREEASKRLAAMGRPAMAALRASLQSEDAEVRLRSRQIIDRIQTSLPYLLDSLKDADPKVRKEAAEVLERLGPALKKAVPALEAALRDKESSVREAALNALIAIDPALDVVAKAVPEKARVGGKYATLLRRIRVEQDRAGYTDFSDFGMYQGTEWAGYTNLPPGYWVYVYPHWYIWRDLKKGK
jgi:HEAT repeat protein